MGKSGGQLIVFEWAMRVAYAIVFVINVMCAVQFCFQPTVFMGAYQLGGVAGSVATQGIGVAFLMWNCTYPLVIWRPSTHLTLAGVVLAQQAVGLVGESLILSGIPSEGYEILASSIMRFIVFDAAGLVLMAVAFALFVVRVRR